MAVPLERLLSGTAESGVAGFSGVDDWLTSNPVSDRSGVRSSSDDDAEDRFASCDGMR